MKVEIPDEFFKIANLLRTQDNRCTDQPIFIVQQKRRITGLNTDYTDNIVWLDAEGDYTEPDDDKLVELEEKYDESGEILEGWIRTGYMDEWEFVTACFTEQGCVDYLAANGHNIKEPRIYADGSYRNREFRLIHNWLLSLSELETVA